MHTVGHISLPAARRQRHQKTKNKHRLVGTADDRSDRAGRCFSSVSDKTSAKLMQGAPSDRIRGSLLSIGYRKIFIREGLGATKRTAAGVALCADIVPTIEKQAEAWLHGAVSDAVWSVFSLPTAKVIKIDAADRGCGNKMSKSIEISVIIPVYNGERYLKQTLNSVLRQSGPSLEVIFIDDGSTDTSLSMLQRCAAGDSRIRVYTQKNRYAGVARNCGMKKARGEYIAFLDADDFYLEGALEYLFKLAEKNRLDWVKGRFRCLDSSNGKQYTTPFSTNSSIGWGKRKKVLNFRQMPERLLQTADVPWNGLYRRSFLEENNIMFNNLRCINDHSFYIQCLLKAQRLMITDKIIVCYRVAQQNSLVGRKAEHYAAQLDNYSIVRKLCTDIEPELKQLILRQEINGILGWYERLLPQAAEPAALKAQLRMFLQSYDEAEVGENYLQQFPFRSLYYGLRYETPPSGKRPGPAKRLLNCQKEHGLYYTLIQIKNRLERKHGAD